MTSTLPPDEHVRLSQTLDRWGVLPDATERLLADAALPAGVIGVSADAGLPRGLGILVDPSTDPELGELLAWRAGVSDAELAAGLEVPYAATTAFLCPDEPEALLACTIELARPRSLRRTFLLTVSDDTLMLGWLAEPGATIWLASHQPAERVSRRDGVALPADIWTHALPIAQTLDTSDEINRAIDHVSQGDQTWAEFAATGDSGETDERDPDDDEWTPWEDVLGDLEVDERFTEFFRRMTALDDAIYRLCEVYGADEIAVMEAVGVMHEQDYVPIPDRGDGLYLARLGKAIAQIGGHLELRAVYPDTTHLILTEPTIREPDTDLPDDKTFTARTPAADARIGWRASRYRHHPRFAHAFHRLERMEDVLHQLVQHRPVNETALAATDILYSDGEALIIPDNGLYIANLGKLIASTGGHLEIRAIFPDQTHLLNAEPGPSRPRST